MQVVPMILKRFFTMCTPGCNAVISENVALNITPVEQLKFQSMLSNLGAHKQACTYFNLPLVPANDMPRRDVLTVFKQCCGAEGDDTLIDTPAEIEDAVKKVSENMGLELTAAELKATVADVSDACWDFDAFYDWYCGTFRLRAVPQLKALWNHTLNFLTAFCVRNQKNQQALYEMLLAPGSTVSLMDHMLDNELHIPGLLTAIFEGNAPLSDKVKSTTLAQVDLQGCRWASTGSAKF